MMLVGRHFQEGLLYQVAHAFEQHEDWRKLSAHARGDNKMVIRSFRKFGTTSSTRKPLGSSSVLRSVNDGSVHPLGVEWVIQAECLRFDEDCSTGL